MKIYVAGPLAAVAAVRAVQTTVVEGHELTLDWTEDGSLVDDYSSQLAVSARLAEQELDAVLVAESVFYFHPRFQRVASVEDWLGLLR